MSSLEKELFKKSGLANLSRLPEQKEEQEEENSPQEQRLPPRRRSKQHYEASSWNEYFDECSDVTVESNSFRIYRKTPAKETGVTFVMHHGAGSSALTFGLVAKAISEMTQRECGILAFDCRGHGATVTTDDSDYSLATLSDDLTGLIKNIFDDKQDIILVGHSMGGSVVVDVAQKRRVSNIMGVTVLDVVEGSAMDALTSMTTIANSRPSCFQSVEQAISWSVQSDTLRNSASARLSIPALLTESNSSFVWITDLIATRPYWTEWFQGLSEKFLSSGTAKLLILAGTDRLDKPLIIGQMQGKFQLQIFPDAGHFLQEDVPGKTAGCLIEFWKRNKRLVLPPKVKINMK
ncbi:protein phosphatase methylesterase 1, partial [Backusella circina FSU 941]